MEETMNTINEEVTNNAVVEGIDDGGCSVGGVVVKVLIAAGLTVAGIFAGKKLYNKYQDYKAKKEQSTEEYLEAGEVIDGDELIDSDSEN